MDARWAGKFINGAILITNASIIITPGVLPSITDPHFDALVSGHNLFICPNQKSKREKRENPWNTDVDMKFKF